LRHTEGYQSRRQQAQWEVRLAAYQEQLSRQEQRLALYSDALLKFVKKMASQSPSRTNPS